jgi:cyclic beta-1,2-glucan synthetase
MAARPFASTSVAFSPLRNLRPEAQRLIDPRRGLLPAPVRAVLFGLERFQQHGVSLAQAQPLSDDTRLAGRFFPRLQANLQTLKRARGYLDTLDREGDALSPAAEWLLDNFHLIEAQLPEIHNGLPRQYYAELPKLRDAPLAGLPRVYGIAWAFVAHTDSNFDAALLTQFLQAYQQVDRLTLGELWALPTTLRVVLLENLARLAENVASHKAAREAANAWCDQQDAFGTSQLDALYQSLERRGLHVPFLAQMVQRLRRPVPGDPPAWGDWLNQKVPDGNAALAAAQELGAANNVSVSHAVTALRAINNLDWKALIDAVSPVLATLRQSETFRRDSELTQDQVTHAIEHIAQRLGRTESDVAAQALTLAEAAGSGPAQFLIGPGRGELAAALGGSAARIAGRGARLSLRSRGLVYAGTLALGTLGVAWAVLGGHRLPGWGAFIAWLLLLLPASECVVALVHRLVGESVPVQRLPRLALDDGLQPAQRTLVVVPCMLSQGGIAALAHRLEQHALANPENHTQFALLSDWADAPQRQAPDDQILLDAAAEAIAELNRRHLMPDGEPPRFLLLHRERSWSDTEGVWMGWERKRGKLERLLAALAAGEQSPVVDLGDISRIADGVRYLVTLDSDTQLPPGALREMVGIASHPLNRPRIDERTRRVVEGYGILQPRVAMPIPKRQDITPFGWMFSGPWGIDTYNAGSSEVYQDVFGEGSFSGKGLLDVQAVHTVLKGRVADGRLLSHDLYEGMWARAALLSDVVVLEAYPSHPEVAASRNHRWARGDWQLLAFLGEAWRGGVGPLNLWKLFDNLRRSLLPLAMVALLWWSFATASLAPLATALLVLAALGLGPLMGALAGLAPSRDDIALRHFAREGLRELARAVAGTAWQLATLLHSATLQLDAAARALWRMAVSRRGLLQWTTAAQAEASARRDLAGFWRRHAATSGLALAWAASGWFMPWAERAWLLAFGALWLLTPLWLWWASQPLKRNGPALNADEQAELHHLARDTWRLFETAVTADDHFLPPDNLQTDPRPMLARRTSPTNIGLYLLSSASAWRLGFIGTTELVERLQQTLDTLNQLPRYRGHFYNWIDTSNLQTLQPAYVSTVDSGNLAGHLWTVAQACREAATTPAEQAAARSHHALTMALRRLHAASDVRLRSLLADPAVQALLADAPWPALQDAPRPLRLRWAAARQRWQALAEVADDASATTALLPFADLLRQLDSRLRDCEAELADAGHGAALQQLAQRLDSFAQAMEFGFLYDAKRRLFHIGFRPGDAALDASYYDLLASESRLTSFVAIAKGDVPRRHWTALGRPFIDVAGQPALLSWSGSMFEYLMPSLVMDEPDGGLLQRMVRAAVQAQQAFGSETRTPWGVSESAYFGQDHTLAFQYSPFGVPRLALRRTPPEDRVIAPYASVLALLADPAAALANLRRLEGLGARGAYGFIEALDYTEARMTAKGEPQLVSTFMAHHQGMSLVALCALLAETPGELGDSPRGWFSRAPLAEAHASLLHERLPREIVLQAGAQPRPELATEPVALTVRTIEADASTRGLQPTQLLGNGSYSVSLRPGGAGGSHWRGRSVSRTRDDALRDAHGTWLLLRRTGEVEFHSLTRQPNPRPDARYVTRFFNDHVEFDAECDEWESKVVVWVSSDDDVEFRRVTLHNLSENDIEFELLSMFEAVLAPQRADESHPAFSNLFIQAHAADPRCVLLERRPRLEGDKAMWAAHFMATCDGEPGFVRISADRARVLPRLGHIAQVRPGAPQTPDAQGLLDTGLDPVASLAVRLKVPAQARLCLTFATAAAADRETLNAVIDKYRQDVHLQRARLMSATLARIRQRELRVEPGDIHAVQDLTTLMLTSRSRRRGLPDTALDRRALWRFGISGDKPIALVRVNSLQGMPLVQALLTAQRLWEVAGLATDLVIVNGEPSSYLMPLQQHIAAIRNSIGADASNQPDKGGVHVLRLQDCSPAELAALQAYGRIDLLADGRPLARLLQQVLPDLEAPTPSALPSSGRRRRAAIANAPWPEELATSRFASEGRAFEIALNSQRVTPRPWVNVLANPQFGTIVSESGGGFSWFGNSRMNQLTTWSNDALLDPASEHFLLQDRGGGDKAGEQYGEVWGLLPTLDRNHQEGYRVSHRQGLSSFSHQRPGLAVEVRIAVHPTEAAKVLSVSLRNTGTQPRTVRLVGMAEWVIGSQRSDRMTLATEYVPEVQAVLARQLEHMGGFGDSTAFLMLAGAPQVTQWTCARSEFFDAQGEFSVPRQMSGVSGIGLDPCGALSAEVQLKPGIELVFDWVLGCAPGREAAVALARRLRVPGALSGVPQQALDDWEQRLTAVTVRTPDPLFDALVNRWLLYQALVCRLWAKAGFYQAGGATGYRDQLQDAMALVHAEPKRLRDQILVNATRQFPEGDVQHWWHMPTGAGVRTHFSDDLLWLPYATQHYLAVTGDASVLDETTPFLEGQAVPEGAEDAYYVPGISQQTASVFEHAARTIDRSLAAGVHGLPLMGTGDWNDGMNRVGHQHRGESVWLGWFLLVILQEWIPLARSRGEEARAQAWEARQRELEQAMRKHGWDGAWYRRAYFDNGHPLGSHLNEECQIDLIAQAWSVFASPPGDAQAAQAMASADAQLVDRQVGVVRLLHPPLQHQADNAGYIQAYPPGVRENGGQYSHAAVWALMAQAQLGHADKAWEYFTMLSPAHRAQMAAGQRRYRIEPYVMPGDTYSQAPYAGRGGWSWYSGSAAWLYRAATESIIGLVVRGDRFCFNPCLPPHWPQAEVTLKLRERQVTVLLQVIGQAEGGLMDRERASADVRRVTAGQWVEFASLPAVSKLVVGVAAAPAPAPQSQDETQPA